MGVKKFLSVDGVIRGEVREGEAPRQFVLDAMGSVVEVYQAGALKADASYTADGDMLSASWNMSSYSFRWLGGWGYRYTGKDWMNTYVRARHYSTSDGGWGSVDPLWPSEAAYRYVDGRVMGAVDPSGMETATCPNDDPYADCIGTAKNNLYSDRMACIKCQMKLNGLTLDRAKGRCRHLKDTYWGPKPPGIPVRKDRNNKELPPELRDMVDLALQILPTSINVAVGALEGGKDIFCIKMLKALDVKWKNFCSGENPGRSAYPNTTPEYWDSYCSYLEFAVNEWKEFCS